MMKRVIFFLLFVFLIFSCSDVFESSHTSSQQIDFRASFSLEQETLLGDKIRTKAPMDIDEDTISDVWTFQFNGTELSSLRVANPQYSNVRSSFLALNLTSSVNENRIVFIANTHDSLINWNSINNYQALINYLKTVSSESVLYGEGKGMIMSAYKDMIVNNNTSQNSLDVKFIRSLAKIELNLSLLNVSNLVVQKIEICNVPDRLLYADKLKSIHNTVSIPYTPSSSFVSYDINTDLPVAGGGAKTYHWYVPRNQQGLGLGVSSITKNLTAPSKALHLRIHTISEGILPVVFRIYPGANMMNDFNIVPNNKYVINLQLNSKGDPSYDSRIEL